MEKKSQKPILQSVAFMACSLSNHADNLDNEICKTCGIKYKNCECCLEYKALKKI